MPFVPPVTSATVPFSSLMSASFPRAV